MIRVHVLSERPVNQNTRAFLSPVIWNRRRIRQHGISVRFFFEATEDIGDCDILAVNSKFWSATSQSGRDAAAEWLSRMKEQTARLVFFDRSSTAGHITTELLPIVDVYCKTTLFKDRTIYRQPLYASRLFCHYYHTEFGVDDDEPTYSSAVADTTLLDKLRLSWNTSLANYSLLGPRLAMLYDRIPFRALLAPTRNFYAPSAARSIDVNCRMALKYKYNSLGYQRKTISQILSNYHETERIPKYKYFNELRNSKIVSSPFGSSEINYKDFESFISGAILLKPNMDHMDTYPNLYRDGETFVSHRWDFEDVMDKIDDILSNHAQYLDIAHEGQETYRRSVATAEGQEEFAHRFADLLIGRNTSVP